MRVIPWKTSIKASGSRTMELEDLRYFGNKLELVLIDENSESEWQMMFEPLQAFRILSEECALNVLASFPQNGGFFEVLDSAWILELGEPKLDILSRSKHFIVSSYEEVIEVLSEDCIIERM